MLKLKDKKKQYSDNGDADYTRLKDKLAIDKNGLDDDVADQPFLLMEVSEKYSAAVDDRDARKVELEQYSDECALRIRKDFSDGGKKGKGITNDEVNARVGLDSRYQRLQQGLLQSTSSAARWGNLKEAFMQRGYMLREMCGLFAAQYWSKSAIEAPAKEELAKRGRSGSMGFRGK